MSFADTTAPPDLLGGGRAPSRIINWEMRELIKHGDDTVVGLILHRGHLSGGVEWVERGSEPSGTSAIARSPERRASSLGARPSVGCAFGYGEPTSRRRTTFPGDRLYPRQPCGFEVRAREFPRSQRPRLREFLAEKHSSYRCGWILFTHRCRVERGIGSPSPARISAAIRVLPLARAVPQPRARSAPRCSWCACVLLDEAGRRAWSSCTQFSQQRRRQLRLAGGWPSPFGSKIYLLLSESDSSSPQPSRRSALRAPSAPAK